MKKQILLLILLFAYVFMQAQSYITVNDLTPGTLSTRMSSSELDHVSNLILTGTIDARDFKTMRDKMPKLSYVDLESVTIAEYLGQEGTTLFTGEPVQDFPYPANSIPDGAFYEGFYFNENKDLQYVILPSSITAIGNSAFGLCDHLISINIPASVTSIGLQAFKYCNLLTTLTIPASVTSIGDETFSNCIGLKSIIAYPTTPVTLPSASIFYGVDKTACTLYVPAPSLDLYKTADIWKDFLKIEAIPIDPSSQGFISESKLWRIGGKIYSEPCCGYLNAAYKFRGDSTINDTTYWKLYTATDENFSNWQLDGLWRETSDKKIFRRGRKFTSDPEEVMYDFSLRENDTFIAHGDTFKVDSLVMRNWGGKLRNHWYLNPVSGDEFHRTVWIEGVGQENNFTWNINGSVGALHIFMCFTENGQLVYQNPEYNACFYTSSLNIPNPDKKIKVYPNPASGSLFVEVMFNEKEYNLELYSMTGELVKTECLQKGVNLFTLDVGALKNGTYILLLTSGSEKYIEKVIIEK